MIDINSSGLRVDAVKASANQLKLLVEQTLHTMPEKESYRRLQKQIQALDQVVAKGDAQQAETALSTAKSGITELTTKETKAAEAQPGVDIYA